MSLLTPNPYVGPRAFTEEDGARFFGRERELEELFHLLITRRLVLLHAPSGAGKSSLIQARLMPRLRDEGFLGRPILRVGAEMASVAGANRYRSATLQGLDEAQARPAIQGPARAAVGCFDDEAAHQLADDLRQTTVQRPDGSSERMLGQAIEPVQLQVVCYRLWERASNASGAAPTITALDLEASGSVDTALEAYFAARVATIAAAVGVAERRIRDWVEARLITEGGLRGQVMREPEATGSLPNRAVQALVNAHLVRAEARRGTTWYELAHDRLVAPLQANNAAWREANLTPLQRQAALWDAQGRSERLLLRDGELERFAQEMLEPIEIEQAFLEASRGAHALALREQRQRQTRRLAWGAALFGSLGVAFAGVALWLYFQAEAESASRQAQTAEADAQVARQVEAAQRLAFAAQSLHGNNIVNSDTYVGILVAVYSPDGSKIVTGSEYSGSVVVWDAASGASLNESANAGSVNSVAFSPDGGRIIAVASGGLYGMSVQQYLVGDAALISAANCRLWRGFTNDELRRFNLSQQPVFVRHPATCS